MAKKTSRIIFEKALGFLVFLLILAIANIIALGTSSQVFIMIVFFFNANLLLIFLVSLFSALSEVSWNFDFPLNVFSPFLTAFSLVFSLAFIFNMVRFIGIMTGSGIAVSEAFETAAYPWAFGLALVFGYIAVFLRATRPNARLCKGHDKKKDSHDKSDWEDVVNDFRMALYEIAASAREAFKKEDEKSRRKTKKSSKKRKAKKAKAKKGKNGKRV